MTIPNSIAALGKTIVLAVVAALLLANVFALSTLIRGAQAAQENRVFVLKSVGVQQSFQRDALLAICEEVEAECPAGWEVVRAPESPQEASK